MREYPKDAHGDGDTLSKEEADYHAVSEDPNEKCHLCSMFVPEHSCTLVEGVIDKNGVCDYFDRKK